MRGGQALGDGRRDGEGGEEVVKHALVVKQETINNSIVIFFKLIKEEHHTCPPFSTPSTPTKLKLSRCCRGLVFLTRPYPEYRLS